MKIGFFCRAAVCFLIFVLGTSIAHAIQCVDYIKEKHPQYKGMTGNAKTWWTQTDKVTQQQTPSVGSVLVFPGPNVAYGHVAYVTKLVSSKEILVNHANWNRDTGKADGTIWTNVRVQDVSEKGNWTKVKIEYGNKGAFGSTPFATYGFVVPKSQLTLKPTGGLGVQCHPKSLNPNETAACLATAYYTNGTNKDVTSSASWVSDKTNATVSGGLVSAKGAVTDTLIKITATYSEGIAQSASSSTLTVLGVDGKHAASLRCDATWSNSKAIKGGTAHLYYSSRCGTYWAKVVPKNTSSKVVATVTRIATKTSFSSSKSDTPTAMVYAPATRACASASIDGNLATNVVCGQ